MPGKIRPSEKVRVSEAEQLKQELNPDLRVGIGRVAISIRVQSLQEYVDSLLENAPYISIDLKRTMVCTHLGEGRVRKITSESSGLSSAKDVLSYIFRSETVDPESSTQDLSTKLFKVETKPLNKDTYRLDAKIIDEASSFYPGGYVLNGERLAINSLMNMENSVSPGRTTIPILAVPLATVVAPARIRARSIAEQMSEIIAPSVELGAIQVI